MILCSVRESSSSLVSFKKKILNTPNTLLLKNILKRKNYAPKYQCNGRPLRPLPTPVAQIAIYSAHVEDDYGIFPQNKTPNQQKSYFQNWAV